MSSQPLARSSPLPCSQTWREWEAGLQGCQLGGKEMPLGAALAGRWSPGSVGNSVFARPKVRAQVCDSELWSRGRWEELMVLIPVRAVLGGSWLEMYWTPGNGLHRPAECGPRECGRTGGVDWWVMPWKVVLCSAPSVWRLLRGSLPSHRSVRVHAAASGSQLRVSGHLHGWPPGPGGSDVTRPSQGQAACVMFLYSSHIKE